MLRLGRIAGITLIAAFAAFALTLLGVRYVVFPQVENHRDNVAAALSRQLGQPVEIDALVAGWDGWNPKLIMTGFRVRDSARVASLPLLELPQVEMIVAWTSMPFLELRLKQLVIERPRLALRRDRAGMLHVGGIEIDPADVEGEPALTDWILRQPQILVRNALITWNDDLRNAPQLVLDRVQLRLEHDFGRHRFGLRGTPPPELAAPIDVRGEWRGGSVRDWHQAEGRLYARLDYADVAAWREWLPLPKELASGKGALRLWFEFAGGVAREITGDVELEDVEARLADNLPKLQLAHLAGRIRWQDDDGRREFLARQLRFSTAAGTDLEPVSFRLVARDATPSTPATTLLEFDQLQLEPLRDLAAQLPLSESVRADLAGFAPRGTLSRGRVQWEGPNDAPTALSGQADFALVGVTAQRLLPGGTGFSGSIEFTPAGGTLKLQSRAATLDLPRVFALPIDLDRLDATATWERKDGATLVRLVSAEFANAHASGQASGLYRTTAKGPGAIDLVAQLANAQVTEVHRYLPRWIDAGTQDWLRRGLAKGIAPEATLKLTGNLAEFPFADGKTGKFQVIAKASGVTLDYAEHWPKLTDIDAVVRFEGKGLFIDSRSARILGTQIGKTHAEIPDLDAAIPRLGVVGEAVGPATEFLHFVEESPVAAWIGDVTRRAEASGNGRLGLRLDLALGNEADNKVAGDFTFVDAQLRLQSVPPLSKVNGKLSFTESEFDARDIELEVMGGPARVSLGNADGHLRVTGSGVASVAALRSEISMPLGDRLTGTLPWSVVIDAAPAGVTWTVDSSTAGMAIDLPPPIGKRNEDAVPLRVVRQPIADHPDSELLSVRYGGDLQVVGRRRQADAGVEWERVEVAVGPKARSGVPASAERSGTWLKADLPVLDLDAWIAVLRRPSAAGTGTQAKSENLPAFSGFDLDIGQLEAFGGSWNGIRVAGRPAAADLKLELAGRDVTGSAVWSPPGVGHPNGRLTARLSRLATGGGPDRPATVSELPPEDATTAGAWPELDIAADLYVSKGRELGRLELVALPRGAEWQIRQLRLVAEEGRLDAEGAWRGGSRRQQTKLDVLLDVRDAAGFLARFGFPNAVQGAPTKITGQLAWAGAPNGLDFPTLTGTFRVDVGPGRFTKVEPGIGKLLGVLSLQALPRRITLDFRDIFSEGFTFDQINGTVRVDRGILTTDNLKLLGPAAKVEITGDADLAQETQRLHVRVQPTLSAGVSAGAALLFLANPIVGAVVGAGSLLAQKMLQDPIEQMFSYDYEVTGSWSDPVVAKGAPSKSDVPATKGAQ